MRSILTVFEPVYTLRNRVGASLVERYSSDPVSVRSKSELEGAAYKTTENMLQKFTDAYREAVTYWKEANCRERDF